MWVGLVGVCVNEGNLSVEKDLGTGGTEGVLEAAWGGCWPGVELKIPLSRFDFLVRTRPFEVVGLSVTSLALECSGILIVPVKDLRRFASTFNEFFLDSPSLTGLATSFAGEEDLDCGKIHDFLRSFVSDRAGDDELGDSACFRVSVRLRSGLGSTEGSRLLLEKDRNLDDRREMVGFN